MCALVNTQRASSKKAKAKIFEYFCKDLSSTLERVSNSSGTSDVIFVVGRNVYHGHQKTLSVFSEKLKRCFQLENGETDYTHNNDCLIKVTRSESSNSLKIFIDAPVDAFEAVLNYMSTLKLTVPEELMPAVYYISKGLQIPTLQKICTEFLINNLSINFVGVLCRFVQFNGLYTKSNEYTNNSDELCLSEICLAKSLHHYLLTEADKIACSQTGILSARLIVNLTGNFNSSEDQAKCQEPSSEYLAFGVLRWAFERLLTGERLARAGSDDNVYSDDEESDGNSSSHAGESSSTSQRKRAGSHFQFLAQKNLLSGSRSKNGGCGGVGGGMSTPQDDFISDEDDADAEVEVEERACISNNLDPLRFFSTQDIRISLDINDLLLGKEENCRSKVGSQDINGSQGKNSLLTVCLTTGSQASETCLLAPTTLGVSSTSIWLGKLAGYLVSLSIKRCHPAYRSIQQLDEELMLEVNQSRSRHQSRGSSLPNNNTTSMPCGLNNCVENGFNVTNGNGGGNAGRLESPTHSCLPTKMESDDEVCQTMTANSALHLARAAAVASVHESFSGQIYQSELLCCGGLCSGGGSIGGSSTDGAAMDTPMRMLEARSGFGVGHLTCGDSKHHIVIVGGYTRKGCLDSVEMFTENNNNSSELCSDEDCPVHPPVAGPRLTKQRGRLAVVSSYLQSYSNSPDVIYACGGSTGSKDLASVDRLTAESLKSWFANHETTKNGHADINTVEYTNGSSKSTDTRLRTDSLVHSNGGGGTSTNGSATANISFWQPIKSLHEARTNPVAVDLSYLHQGPLISNSKGSILVAGGVCGAQYLSSVEAYIPDRDEWVYMPSMLQGRREACAGVLTARNLIVVIGGVINTNSAYRSSPNITVEALDPRCAAWFYIPNPLANSIGQLRSASLTYCPNVKDNLLLVGGYNGQETLDATWIFDSAAWKWRSGPNLLFARSSCGATQTSDQRCNLIFGGYNPTKSSCGFLDTIEVIF
ncbi:unnamed protein product [Trichobilharzia szidati]|nr:unnamed protein product [Trichobilharzia szidati]